VLVYQIYLVQNDIASTDNTHGLAISLALTQGTSRSTSPSASLTINLCYAEAEATYCLPTYLRRAGSIKPNKPPNSPARPIHTQKRVIHIYISYPRPGVLPRASNGNWRRQEPIPIQHTYQKTDYRHCVRSRHHLSDQTDGKTRKAFTSVFASSASQCLHSRRREYERDRQEKEALECESKSFPFQAIHLATRQYYQQYRQ
jgi:hypothetical protein